MPPQPGMFLSDISQYRPMYGGVDPRPYQGLDTSSWLGTGPAGAMGNMLLQPMMTQLMGQQGMMPGQFQPSMNLYDRMQAQQFFQQQQQSMQVAAQGDLFQQRQMLGGMLQMATGKPLNQQQQNLINQGTQQLQPLMPMLAQTMPDLVDALHGPRGSSTVMAQQFHLGGRGMFDPSTGRYGLSGEAAGRMAGQVFQNLYGEGADVSQMRGLGAARAGQLFSEMSNRGYISGGGGADAPGGGTQGLDSKRVASRLKEVSGAVAAMRDIFGEMGDTNAPMPKLINGINALTQGGMSTMGGAELEMTVRKAANLARSSGMGMDAMMQLMGTAAQRGDQLGLDRSFAPGAAMRGASFGQAFKAVGGADVAGFGRMDAERMTAMSTNLQVQADASPMANMLGAAARMVSEGMAKPDSDMAKMVEATKKGQTTFTNSQGQQVNIAEMANDPQAFIGMAGAAGVNAGTAGQILRSEKSNQEYVRKEGFGIRGAARKAQGAGEIMAVIQSSAAMAITPVLSERGFGDVEAARLTPLLSNTVAQTLRSMKPEDRENPTRRHALIAQALRAAIGEEDFRRLGSSDEERMAMLMQISGATTSNINEMISQDPSLAGYETYGNMLDAHNEGTLAAADVADRQEGQRADSQRELAHLGQDGPTRRVAGAVAEAGPGTTIGELIAKAMGGVDQSKIDKALKMTPQQLAETGSGRKAGEGGKVGEAPATRASVSIPATGGGGGAGDGRIEIAGTLTLKQDGTAELGGTGHRGGAQSPGGR